MYEPPDPGIAAPSSLQIMPSEMVITRATSQPSIACGPPSAESRRGIVMNGPMPIMFVMLSAVASSKPKRRNKCGCSSRFAGPALIVVRCLWLAKSRLRGKGGPYGNQGQAERVAPGCKLYFEQSTESAKYQRQLFRSFRAATVILLLTRGDAPHVVRRL